MPGQGVMVVQPDMVETSESESEFTEKDGHPGTGSHANHKLNISRQHSLASTPDSRSKTTMQDQISTNAKTAVTASLQRTTHVNTNNSNAQMDKTAEKGHWDSAVEAEKEIYNTQAINTTENIHERKMWLGEITGAP